MTSSQFAGKTIILYNDSPAPVPAGDPRYDFYTGNLDYSATGGANNQGGAPSTLPGFGPNTRTIMQFRVAGTDPAPATPGPVDYYNPALLTALQTDSLAGDLQGDPGSRPSCRNRLIMRSATRGVPPRDTYAAHPGPLLDLHSLRVNHADQQWLLQNKAIQELFDPEGRMNATLGVELPFTSALIQTTIPLGFIDPTTETLAAGETQLWKITHNGVDTHGIHFHLVNVQVINRVGWDGAIRPPDPNELGWKDTVRMNPLEDIIVAMRAKVPTVSPSRFPTAFAPDAPALPVFPTRAPLSQA